MNATAEQLTYEERVALCWRAGDLSWKLDPHQKRVYDKYRAWEKDITDTRFLRAVQDREKARGHRGLVRVFVLDIGRRWGKTFLVALIKLEDCLRRPGTFHTYATAYFKDIAEIVQPIIDEICEDAPDDCRPKFRSAAGGKSQGYVFPIRSLGTWNGASRLRLVGIDLHPRALRGRASDGFAVTEAGFVTALAKTIGNVVYPQFQRRRHATCILESNAPEDPDHDFDQKFIPDAKERGAYVSQTIDDNDALTAEEKAEFIEATATATSMEDAMREYYCVRYRDPLRYVCPEFVPPKQPGEESIHVRKLKRPNYAHAYVAGDPGGSKSFFALLWAYWDFERALLYIERDWAVRNAGTYKVAEVCKAAELELWGTKHREATHLRHDRDRDTPLIDVDRAQRTVGGKLWRTPFQAFTYWQGDQFTANPHKRITDLDERLVSDLQQDHELAFVNTTKDNLEAMCNVIRTAFKRGQIVVDPSCTTLIAHLTHCKWDEKRVKWEMHKKYGHYDLVAALVYLWRNVDRAADPNPPAHWDTANVLMGTHPGHKDQHLSRSAGAQIANALGMQPGAGRTSWR